VSTKRYKVGQNVRLQTEFRDDTGALYNPTTTTLKTEDPAGIEVSQASIVNDSTGVFHKDVEATLPGTWQWRWLGDGPSGQKASDEGFYIVSRSPF